MAATTNNNNQFEHNHSPISDPAMEDSTSAEAATPLTTVQVPVDSPKTPSQPSGLRPRRQQTALVNGPTVEPDDANNLIDFVSSPLVYTPLMGVLAAAVNYIGALNLNAYFSTGDETSQSQHDLSQVSGIYGPGTFFTWLLAVNTYMYDEYYYTPSQPKSVAPWFDKSRFVLMICYGLMAFGEQIVLAWKGQFGPSTAAARYVGDKAFESFAIIFAIRIWRDYLHRRRLNPRGALPVSNLPRKPAPYIYWPPFVFLLAWSLGRGLEHIPSSANSPENAIYTIPRHHPQMPIAWRPLIPYTLRPISLPIGVLFGLLCTPGTLLDRFIEGFLKMVWLSSVLLHSGLFGTVGPLRLTSLDFRARDQWIPFCLAVVGAACQYWRDLKGLPWAVRKRVGYVVKWQGKME